MQAPFVNQNSPLGSSRVNSGQYPLEPNLAQQPLKSFRYNRGQQLEFLFGSDLHDLDERRQLFKEIVIFKEAARTYRDLRGTVQYRCYMQTQ